MPPSVDLYPGFVLTLDPDLSGALNALGEQVDYDNGKELPCVLLSIMLFGLVAPHDEVMRAFERLSVHYKNPQSEDYSEFWGGFQATFYVFKRRYIHDEDLKNMIHDVLPRDCDYCEEGLLRVKSSRSGRHFFIS
jgi:hypothetical protein